MGKDCCRSWTPLRQLEVAPRGKNGGLGRGSGRGSIGGVILFLAREFTVYCGVRCLSFLFLLWLDESSSIGPVHGDTWASSLHGQLKRSAT